MSTPEFTDEELDIIAGFIVARVDSMQEAIDDPKVTSESYKRGCRKVVRQLSGLADKLRPYHTGKYDN